ncbi:MAG: hypothetical protein WBM35_01115 [Candidatus Electrothrix sp.]
MERIEAEQFQNGKNQKKEVRYKRFLAIFSSPEGIVSKSPWLSYLYSQAGENLSSSTDRQCGQKNERFKRRYF